MPSIKDAAPESLVNKRVAVTAVPNEPTGVTLAEIALAAGLLVIGAGFAAVASMGPFITGVIEYHVTATLRNQTIGLDAVSLLVVAPLSVVAALLVPYSSSAVNQNDRRGENDEHDRQNNRRQPGAVGRPLPSFKVPGKVALS